MGGGKPQSVSRKYYGHRLKLYEGKNIEVAICTFCNWESVWNATRLTEHLLSRCKQISETKRIEIEQESLQRNTKRKRSLSELSSRKKRIAAAFDLDLTDSDSSSVIREAITDGYSQPSTSAVPPHPSFGDSMKEEELDTLKLMFGKAVYASGASFLMFENPAWTEFFARLNPSFKIPSRRNLAVSKPAPFWKASAIVNGHVTELKLSDYKGRYIVLIFYPQDFSRVCQSELLAVSDRISEFRALNADVVACSVDSFLAHQVWCRTPRSDGGLANPKIALLSDPTHSISKDYGCFMPELGHTLRAYYIVDHRGIIRQITINDIAVGRSTDELLRLVEAFQQTDETEACCPADWKSGQPLYS